MESSEKDCCKDDYEVTMKERMNYFTGRHLAARDFRDEQLHHRSHRFLHNRMLHGWGVVCGLEVREHPQDQCRDRFVQVSSGMAIDCCGREILVDCAICCGDEQPEIPWKEYKDNRPWLMLCLAYDEDGKERVPVLSSEGDCSTAKTEEKYARYKEGWKLAWHWVDDDELQKYSWKAQYVDCAKEGHDDKALRAGSHDPTVLMPGGGPPAAAMPEPVKPADPPPYPHHPQLYPSGDCPHDDCGEPCDEGVRSCLAAKCPPGHCVPLALIRFDKARKITKVIMKGRPEVPSGPQRLTHIVGINWPHGGIISPKWLKHKDRNPLQVTFDRKLEDRAQSEYFPGPSGVNQATFVMQFGEQKEDLDFVDYVHPPHLSDDRLKAEYEIGQRSQAASVQGRNRPVHQESGYAYLVGHTVSISLKCDFLYDCHGVRVDGNNDGLAGGTFESWFSVISDDDYDRMRQEESQ
jgi:hypothetical protein